MNNQEKPFPAKKKAPHHGANHPSSPKKIRQQQGANQSPNGIGQFQEAIQPPSPNRRRQPQGVNQNPSPNRRRQPQGANQNPSLKRRRQPQIPKQNKMEKWKSKSMETKPIDTIQVFSFERKLSPKHIQKLIDENQIAIKAKPVEFRNSWLIKLDLEKNNVQSVLEQLRSQNYDGSQNVAQPYFDLSPLSLITHSLLISDLPDDMSHEDLYQAIKANIDKFLPNALFISNFINPQTAMVTFQSKYQLKIFAEEQLIDELEGCYCEPLTATLNPNEI